MTPASTREKKPNRLMQSMIAVSLAVHVIVFMHIADIYRSRALTCIELTLQNISRPTARAIPRPRARNQAPRPETVHQREPPRHTPVAPVDIPDSGPVSALTADIGAPAVPLSGWDAGGEPVFTTTGNYFDMVRMKIESRKQYPEAAREKHIEGRVLVRFGITADGQVSSLKIAESSGRDLLDRAVLEAVRKAAPFPRPPAALFKGQTLNAELMILFELR